MQITRAGATWRYPLDLSVLRTLTMYCKKGQMVRHPALRVDPPGASLKITSLLSTVFRKLPLSNSTELSKVLLAVNSSWPPDMQDVEP